MVQLSKLKLWSKQKSFIYTCIKRNSMPLLWFDQIVHLKVNKIWALNTYKLSKKMLCYVQKNKLQEVRYLDVRTIICHYNNLLTFKSWISGKYNNSESSSSSNTSSFEPSPSEEKLGSADSSSSGTCSTYGDCAPRVLRWRNE